MPHDGRRARRVRSRDVAVDALLDLLNEGVPRPTAQQVAERSGVSLRSIFRIFDDVETLHTAASMRQLERNRHLWVEISGDGPLEERIEAVVSLHSRLYESVAPVRRAAMRAAPESQPLQAQLDKARGWLASEIERVFAPELDASADRATTASALQMVLSFQAWDQLESAQHLAVDDRNAIVAHTVRALLR
jgi:AcrR family transcriptional regulator